MRTRYIVLLSFLSVLLFLFLVGLVLWKFKYHTFYKMLTKVLTVFGDIMLSTSPPIVVGKNIRKCMEIAQTGDIICRRFDCYLDGYFIPGKYTHSCIVVDNKTIIDSMSEGVRQRDIIDFVKDTDGFIILRPTYKSEDEKKKVIDYAKSKIGSGYDFVFSDENNAYYCHELTALSLQAGGITVPRAGNIYLSSDLEAICKRVYESDDPKFAMSRVVSWFLPIRYHKKI